MANGYYLEGYNFSVEFHNGQWIMRNKLSTDEKARTNIAIVAIRNWLEINKLKFKET